MLITLVWDGVPIPNTDPPSGTHDAINALGLSHDDAENLWALWCSLDALVADQHEAKAWAGADGAEIADLISFPDFINEAQASPDNGDPPFNWLGLPGWVHAQGDKITTTALA